MPSSANTPTTTSSILLVSRFCPSKAHAGGLRILDIYALIKQRLPHVQIDLYTHHRPEVDGSIAEAHQVFDHVYLAPTPQLHAEGLLLLRGKAQRYDVVYIQFHQHGLSLGQLRGLGRTVLFTPMESKTLSLITSLKTIFAPGRARNLKALVANLYYALQEIWCCYRADKVVCVSTSDAAFLQRITGSKTVHTLETGVSPLEFSEALAPGWVATAPAGKPMRIVYVASFGADVNITALHWYLDFVHPLIKAAVPQYQLDVVGKGDMASFARYTDPSIHFVGAVPSIAPHMVQARLGIAPAIWGAGFRGKVNQYAILGIPSVVSPTALLGLAYQDGVSVFVAATPERFAHRCIELLTNSQLNAQVGAAARGVCLAHYTWDSKWESICGIYNLRPVA